MPDNKRFHFPSNRSRHFARFRVLSQHAVRRRLLPVLLALALLILAVFPTAEVLVLPVSAAAADTVSAPTASSKQGSAQPSQTASGAAGSAVSAEQKADAPATRGTAWIDSSILGNLHYDTQVRLQDDFYSSVNQAWLTNTVIPTGENEISPSSSLSDAVREKKRALLRDRSLTDHDAKLTQTLYDMLMDWDTRNAQGIEPIRPYVLAIESISTLKELTAYLCDDAKNLMGNGFSEVGISQNINNPSSYAVEISPTSLLLTDPADYATISAAGKRELALAQSKTYYMLERLGYSDAEQEKIFQNCLAFETALASRMYPQKVTAQTDYAATTANRPCTLQDLKKALHHYPLTNILAARKLDGSDVYNLSQPAWLERLDQLYTKAHLQEMKAYLLVHTVIPAMELTDQVALNAMVELSSSNSGASRTLTPDSIACQYVETLLPEPLDNMYVRAVCTPEEKASVTSLVHELISAWRTVLQNETWLSDTTRCRALQKLDHLRIRVAYPDSLPDYSGLELTDRAHGGDLIHNFQIIRSFSRQQAAALVNQPLDESHWALPASTVNCFYNAQDNSINILAGMLQAPYYRSDMSREELLGGIGFIIGHEISHAFDSQGAAYDENGNISSWWAEADRAEYRARRARLVEYYNGIVPYQGFGHYNGEPLADEAIADLGSMKCLLTLAGRSASFSYDRFFRYFASCWEGLRRPYMELTYMRQDEHPLYYLRVNVTLQQFDAFLNTYQIREGDGMWLAPEERIAIW